MPGILSTLNEKLAQKMSPVTIIVLTFFFTTLLGYFRKKGIKKGLIGLVFGLLSKTPGLKQQIEKEKSKALEEAIKGFPKVKNDVIERELPEKGHSANDIRQRMERIKEQEQIEFKKKSGLSGQIYCNDDEHEKLIGDAFSMYCLSNPLHPETFPSIKKFESEVIRMTLNMMNGNKETVGCCTTGGTESIIMAIKTYRDWARATKGITEPEIVAPITAHCAFNKGCQYFKVKLVHVPVDPVTQKAIPSQMEKYITRNTIAIMGSAPCYSVGVIDPIPELSKLALKYKIGLHVDACLGSFVVPQLEKLGKKVPPFDFRNPGVTSMSCDTHKYGMAVKGNSVLMFKNAALRRHMYFLCPDWVGGFYGSPGMAGSRAGGLISSCWAAMMHYGKDGYFNNAKKIVETVDAIAKAVEENKHVEILGDPQAMLVAVQSKHFNIFCLVDAMKMKGWKMNPVQFPAGAHICVTMRTAGKQDKFIKDMNESIEDILAHPDKFKSGTKAMYGTSAVLPEAETAELIAGVMDSWMDVETATEEK